MVELPKKEWSIQFSNRIAYLDYSTSNDRKYYSLSLHRAQLFCYCCLLKSYTARLDGNITMLKGPIRVRQGCFNMIFSAISFNLDMVTIKPTVKISLANINFHNLLAK